MNIESASELFSRVRRFLTRDLWRFDARAGSPLGVIVRLIQLTSMVAEGFVKDHLLLRASALTYVTALSLIPILAVAISIVHIFDPSNNLATLAVETLAAGSPDAQEKILELVNGVHIARLGGAGAAMLLISTILALRHLEATLNSIWGITRDRTIGRRVADYLALIVIAPLFLGVALSMGATLSSDFAVNWLSDLPFFARLYDLGLGQSPKLLLFAGFSFIFWFFPNTSVRIPSAALGGALTAILFSLAQYSYLGLSVGVARSNALYGGFAALPLLLVWLYVCWAVILLGAELSFAHQNLARYRLELRGGHMGAAETEALGLCVALEAARVFRDRAPLLVAEDLAESLSVSVRDLRQIIEVLEAESVLVFCSTQDRGEGYQLGRSAEMIDLANLRTALRGDDPAILSGDLESSPKVVARWVSELDAATSEIERGQTLAELLADIPRQEPT